MAGVALVDKGVVVVAAGEPSVLDLLSMTGFRAPRLLVVKASRTLLMVFIGFQIGVVVGSKPSEADKQYERVKQSVEQNLKQLGTSTQWRPFARQR